MSERFVIGGESGEWDWEDGPFYWSNSLGWAPLLLADQFSGDEQWEGRLNLLLGFAGRSTKLIIRLPR